MLDTPVHGKPSLVRVLGGRLLRGLPREFVVGRYHSLHARRSNLPTTLLVTAETEDRVIMAIEHVDLPIAAVQFHPESVMTSPSEIGMPIIAAVLTSLAQPGASRLRGVPVSEQPVEHVAPDVNRKTAAQAVGELGCEIAAQSRGQFT